MQVPVPKGKNVTGRYYRDVVLKKAQEILSEKNIQWQDFNMFVYCLIMLKHIHLKLLHKK